MIIEFKSTEGMRVCLDTKYVVSIREESTMNYPEIGMIRIQFVGGASVYSYNLSIYDLILDHMKTGT